MALTGNNGDNETHIGTSNSLDFSLHDESLNEIKIENIQTPIDIWISKDTSVPIEPYTFVNSLNLSISNGSNENLSGGKLMNGILVDGFYLYGLNVSIHIQIKPLQRQRGYLNFIKFGDNPTQEDYDLLNTFCPKNLIRDNNGEEFYLTFINMTRVNSFNGYVGFGIVEIDCSTNFTTNLNILIQNSNFTCNYLQRIFTSGCYYMNILTNDWSSNGMEILSDTNLTHTHCQSNHLTTFAGGFIVLPNAINFNDAFAHASFLQNPVIYSTVIALVCLYLLMAIWTRWMDKKDEEKYGITVLGFDFDCETKNKYLYEIIVFTGNRPNAGTDSRVNFFLNEFNVYF